MRDIKFRIWDGEGMTYLISTGIQKFDYEDGLVLAFAVDGYKEFYAHECYRNLLGDYPIMQYTGIKDEGGEEIWEGDIVKVYQEDEPEDCFSIRKIIFSQGMFEFYPTLESGSFDGYIGVGGLEGDGRYCEVIGNIYENKDLLNP